MAKLQYRIHLRRGDAHLELEGSEDFVERHFRELQSLITDEAVRAEAKDINLPSKTPEMSGPAELSESFGERLTQFGTITDVDKILVAGHFQQTVLSDDNLFSTREANGLLKDQGVKLSNPSTSIRQNISGKKVFKEGKKFRVSKQGEDHIQELLAIAGGT